MLTNRDLIFDFLKKQFILLETCFIYLFIVKVIRYLFFK